MSTGTGNSRFNAYRRWEIRFDAVLSQTVNKDPREAWSTLRQRGCDACCLKGSLFYAAQKLEVAQDIQQFSAFSEAREAILQQLPGLQKILKALAAPTVQGCQVGRLLSSLCGLTRNDARTVERFPSAVKNFEAILTALRVPQLGKPDIAEDAEIVTGEALLHVYVEEITGKCFYREIAILLAASVDAYGLDELRSYDPDSVQRRYRRWYHEKKHGGHELRRQVQELKHDPENFLKNFVDQGVIVTALEFGVVGLLETAVSGPTRTGRNGKPRLLGDPLKPFWRVLRAMDQQKKPPSSSESV